MLRQTSVMGVKGTVAASPRRDVPGANDTACSWSAGKALPLPCAASAPATLSRDASAESRGLPATERRASVADSVLSALRATSSFCSSSDTAGGGGEPHTCCLH